TSNTPPDGYRDVAEPLVIPLHRPAERAERLLPPQHGMHRLDRDFVGSAHPRGEHGADVAHVARPDDVLPVEADRALQLFARAAEWLPAGAQPRLHARSRRSGEDNPWPDFGPRPNR